MQAAVERVTELLAAGEVSTALATLLELWRRTPARELADAIDRVGALVPDTPADLAGKGWDVQGRWEATARANRPDDVGRLCATLLDVVPNLAARRVELLAERPADPRIALALAHHIRARPLTTSTAARFYQRALDLIARIGDVRALDVLPEAAEPVNARRNTRADITLEVYLPGARDQLAALAPPTLAPAIVERLCALAPPPPAAPPSRPPPTPRDLDALLAAVYADLDADGPRLVLADALQEVEDPRGELIALQLARARTGGTRATSREAALVKAHGRAWMGELAPLIHAKGWYYARGFLAGCRLSTDGPPPPSRLWATLEELHCRGFSGRHASSFVLGLPRLRVLSGVTSEVASALATAAAPPPHLASLSFGTIPNYFGDRETAGALARLAGARCALRLHRLAVVRWSAEPDDVRRVLEAPIAERLEQLVVCGRPRELAMWLDTIGDAGPALRTLELRSDGHLEEDLTGHRLIVHRDGGRFTAVDAIGPYREAGPRGSAIAAEASAEAIGPAVTALGLELRMRSKRDGRA